MKGLQDMLARWFPWIIAASALLVIAATAYAFLYRGDFDFVVEAPCDPTIETCFYRDCSEEDSCPPNGLSEYRVFTLAARDFPLCADNTCLAECTSGAISCEELVCGESEEDECAAPTTERGVEESPATEDDGA